MALHGSCSHVHLTMKAMRYFVRTLSAVSERFDCNSIGWNRMMNYYYWYANSQRER